MISIGGPTPDYPKLSERAVIYERELKVRKPLCASKLRVCNIQLEEIKLPSLILQAQQPRPRKEVGKTRSEQYIFVICVHAVPREWAQFRPL